METSETLNNEAAKFAGTQIAPIKCFLCDKNFMVGDESYLMFESRLMENDEEDVSMATVLSSAIGKEINESTAHSKVLCNSCNEFVLEYEIIEQRYIQLKYKLIKDYNRIATKYETEVVSLEISEPENDQITQTNNVDIIEQNDMQSIRADITLNKDEDIFEYLIDKNFITIESKNEVNLEQQLNNNPKNNIIKIDNVYIQNMDENGAVNGEINSMENNSTDVSQEDVNFDEIVEQNQFSVDDNTIEDESDSNSLNFIADDNTSSLKSTDLTQFESESQKSKLVTSTTITTNVRPSFLFDGEKYFCMLCESGGLEKKLEKFDSKTISIHLKQKHAVILYVCSFCSGGFLRKSELTNHIETTKCGLESGVYECNVCYKTFDNMRNFRSHEKIHIKSSFECHICKKKFSKQKLFDEHLSLHKGARPFKCYICSKDFASKYTLNSHTKIHSDRQRPYFCDKCHKSFLTAANLQQHNRTHSSIKQFVCDVCDKSFATQHNLDVHKIIHTGHKPFLCRTCGKCFARRAEITDHERTHTGEKPFECDICGMRFAQRSNLSTHKKSTHFNEKKHKCDICSKSFKRKRLLDYHVQAAHTGERPYKCETCHSTFVYPEHYKKHLRIHSGVKPYMCEVCGKSFNSRDNRNAHRFIHSDKKPYECLTCGQGFMRKPLLYNHMQSIGHINDTIIVNQPRIKENPEITESDNTEIQIMEDNSSNSNYKMIMDTRVILMDEDDEMDEIILEEEHLIDSIDGHEDSVTNDNETDFEVNHQDNSIDESYSINNIFRK